MINKIVLRKPFIGDLKKLLIWENDLKNTSFTDHPFFYSIDDLQDFLNSDQELLIDNQKRFIISFDEEAIGCIDLYAFDLVNSRAGVGVFIDSKFRSQGFGTMSIQLLKKISIKDYSINSLYAEISCKNEPSIKAFEKSGFVKNGIKKNWIRTQESFEDVIFYQCFLINN